MLGWAATIEEFRERGLHYDLNLGEVIYQTSFGTNAGAEFFNISDNVSCHLFMPITYGFGSNNFNRGETITKAHAIERLEVLINHVEKVQSKEKQQ